MQFIDEDGHRVLTYIHALAEVGYSIHTNELEAYGQGHERRYDVTGGSFANFLKTSPLLQGKRKPKESVLHWLTRLHWVSADRHNVVSLTPLGRAVLRAANVRTTELSDEIAEVVLDPDDPYHYAALAGQLAQADHALLVDPYFRLEQFRFITQFDTISRVLTSERLTPPQVTEEHLRSRTFGPRKRACHLLGARNDLDTSSSYRATFP